MYDSLNWSDFTQYCADHIINEVSFQKFASRWDWKVISNRDCFYNDWTLLEKFADKADWSEVITNLGLRSEVVPLRPDFKSLLAICLKSSNFAMENFAFGTAHRVVPDDHQLRSRQHALNSSHD